MVAETQPHLARRELQFLRLIAAGLTSRQIARREKIAISTVTMAVSEATRKLGCQTRAQACVVAERAGLLDDDRQVAR